MKRSDSINKAAILEAGRFNQKVANFMNSETGKQFTKYAHMTPAQYMKGINDSGFKTNLEEKDFHAMQEKTFWVQLMDFMNAFRQEAEYQLAFWIEYLRLTNPEKHAEITKTFKEVKDNEDKQIEKEMADAKEKEKGVTEMSTAKIQPMNCREKTTMMSITTSSFSSIFSSFRGITEIMQAVYGDQIEKMREASAFAVKEDKAKGKTAK